MRPKPSQGWGEVTFRAKRVFYLVTGVQRSQQHHSPCRRTINVLIFGFQSGGAKESERKDEQQKKEKQKGRGQHSHTASPVQDSVGTSHSPRSLPFNLISSSLKQDPGSNRKSLTCS